MDQHDTTEEHTMTDADANPAETTSGAAPSPSAPRLRWAAIVWGIVLAGIAGWGLRVFSDLDRRTDAARWIGELTVASGIAYAVLALGALVLILGVIGVLRRSQRSRERQQL